MLKNIDKINILVRYHGSGYMFANFIVHMLPSAKTIRLYCFLCDITLHASKSCLSNVFCYQNFN
jgi:hypothetical protein